MADELAPVSPSDESPLEPYERQPGEPSKAFSVFAIYRDMGVRRSIKKSVKQFYGAEYNAGKLRMGQEWSRTWDWVRRVAAWDGYLDREARISQTEAVREMNRRYANTAKAVLSKAVQGLKHVKSDELDATEIARLIEVANKIERLCHGEATEHTKSDVKTELSGSLEVVERIVPVRGTVVQTGPGPASLPAHAPGAALAPSELGASPAESGIEDAQFDLPDEQPPGL